MNRGLVLCGFLVPAVLVVADLVGCSEATSGTAPAGAEDASADAGAGDGALDRTLPPEAGDAAAPDGRDTGVAEGAVHDGEVDAVSEAASDGGVEAAPCSGVICNGQCMAATDCHACAGAPLLCGPTGHCIASCQGCADSNEAGLPVECFACDSTHQNPIGTCQYNDAGSYCLSGNYTGQYDGGPGYRCGCTDLTGCPGGTQVCVPLGNLGGSFCLTCGEATLATIQGQPCHDGGTCQANLAACQ